VPRQRRVKPYLLPDCNLEYARGIYQGEGSFGCEVSHKRQKARPRMGVYMEDKEALQPLERCFGVGVRFHGKSPTGGHVYAVERVGRAALALAQALATTTTRKQQIQTAMTRCRELWKKGYKDALPL